MKALDEYILMVLFVFVYMKRVHFLVILSLIWTEKHNAIRVKMKES